MNFISQIYQLIFYQPILKILYFLSQTLKDFGIAIFGLTIFIRIIFFPLNLRMHKNEEKMARVQKKISELMKKNQKENFKEILEIYKKEKINPFSNFLLLLIQLPILIAIYQILKTPSLFNIPPVFFGYFDLSKPNLIFPLLASFFIIFPFLKQSPSNQAIVYFSAFFTFFILIKFPSAISFYVLSSSVLGLLEKALIFKKIWLT
jgi:YidC/Oxa1 family membrane protein insertase